MKSNELSMNKQKPTLVRRLFNLAFALISLVPAIAAIYLAFYYIYGPGEGFFHSDCTDTLYWAGAALEGNGIFDDQYNYAALLPFSTVWIMQPLIKIFGFGMTAHNLGMSIFTLLFAGSVYFCARSAKFSILWSGTSVFVVFMVLSCSDKLREMMWGHTIYYSLGLILMFALIGLGIRLFESIEGKKIVSAVVFAVLLLGLSIGSATNGMQIIVLTTLPVFAAFCAERLLASKDALISKKTVPGILVALVVGIGTVLGLKVLDYITGDSIVAGYAAGYSGWSAVSEWLGNAQKFVNHYFSLLGVNMHQNDPLFEKESFKYFFRIAVGIFLIAMPVVILCCYGKLKSRGVRIMVWAHFVLTAVVMFGYICGELSAANWRLMPIVGSSIMLTVCGLRDLIGQMGLVDPNLLAVKEESSEDDPEYEAEDVASEEDNSEDLCADEETSEEIEAEVTDMEMPEADNTPMEETADIVESTEAPTVGKLGEIILSRICAAVLAATILSSVVFAKEVEALPEDYGQDNTNHRLAAFLVEEGLEYGYATFWYSQAITVLTNSQARVRNITADRNGVKGRHYQSSLNWYNDQEGVDEYFVLLSAKEYADVSSSVTWNQWMRSCYLRHYEDPNDASGFVIYVFSENILKSFGSDARAE